MARNYAKCAIDFIGLLGFLLIVLPMYMIYEWLGFIMEISLLLFVEQSKKRYQAPLFEIYLKYTNFTINLESKIFGD